MFIRHFTTDDADALRSVFYSSVHTLARDFYTSNQLDAWAPKIYDRQAWLQRLTTNKPFVAIFDDQICGFADLQSTGYIDQFFVAGYFARRGVGAALMEHILNTAIDNCISHTYSYVSLAAEGLFSKYGFHVSERQVVTVRGVHMKNTLMERSSG